MIIALAIFVPVSAFSQSIYDAVRYSSLNYEGTARSLAMGNAMTAAGPDLGAISINPAAGGMFTKSEFTFTPAFTFDHTSSEYGPEINGTNTRFGIANIGWMSSSKTNNIGSFTHINFGITANKTANFNSKMSAFRTESNSNRMSSIASSTNGITQSELDANSAYNNLPWESVLAWDAQLINTLPDSNDNFFAFTENLDDFTGSIYQAGAVNQYYNKEISGYMMDYDFNLSGDINSRLFFGINLKIRSVYYKHTEYYSEEAVDQSKFDSGLINYNYISTLKTNGSMATLQAGLIFVPTNNLKVGASVTIPSYFSLNDKWHDSMEGNFQDPNMNYSAYSPQGDYDYRVTTPLRYSFGASYILFDRAIISIDYEGADYSNIKLKNDEGDEYTYNADNVAISNTFKAINNLRIGGEIKINQQLAIRGGYSHYSSSENGYDGKLDFASFGLGYSENNFRLDIAYQYQINTVKDSYRLYSDYGSIDDPIYAPTLTEKYNTDKLLITVAFTF
ncbi:MAG: hypothetical protein WCS34_06300 [Bacteroidales bacterium]